jgi:cytochrome c oxidase cbb3-type subunit 3
MSSTPLKRAAVALAALAALSALVVLTANAGPGKGNAAAAKGVYASKCVACHKADGSGGIKLTGNPTPNWTDPKVWADPKRTDDFIRDCIVNGKPKSGMVAWKSQLKPADVENLIALIHTFKKK